MTMQVPESIARAYEEELAVVAALRVHASSRLRIIAANNSWLFDDRVKAPESALSKLEMGRVSLREMNDLYAAMLVVPTQKHVAAATDAVLTSFSGEVRPARLTDASSFVYDDIHVIAKLRGRISPLAVPHVSVLDRQFEIQIHTGVQYAWWRATHDDIYKGSSSAGRSWAAKRASGQARASLELIDGVLADFEGAAHLQKAPLSEVDPAEVAREWLRYWSASRRPTDEVRFASTSWAIATAAEIHPDQITQQFVSGALDAYVGRADITPIQVVTIACHLIDGDEIYPRLLAAERRVLVTSELVTAYPPFGDAPAELIATI